MILLLVAKMDLVAQWGTSKDLKRASCLTFPALFPLSLHMTTPTSSPFSASYISYILQLLIWPSIFDHISWLFTSFIAHLALQWGLKETYLIFLSTIAASEQFCKQN